MKITPVGVGSAFAKRELGQSNLIIHGKTGKKFLFDCGTQIGFSLEDIGVKHTDLDALWISHGHADHSGGMEELAFINFFTRKMVAKKDDKIQLFMIKSLRYLLWDHTWSGGLRSIEGRVMGIEDYFDCHDIEINESFEWDGLKFTPVQTVHIMDGFAIVPSYGLIVDDGEVKVFITGDCQFCPSQMVKFYGMVDYIIHDCETAGYKSKVHASYEDLMTLPEDVRKKMFLTHYNMNPTQNPIKDGFLGFLLKGKELEFKRKYEKI